jgi:hypothetical protein
MINYRLLIKVFFLALSLIGVFILKTYLTKSSLTPLVAPFLPPNSGSVKASIIQTSQSSLATSTLEASEHFDRWLMQLQNSTAAVDQIAKAIYEKDAKKNLVTLKALLETEPQNSLVNYLLIQVCLSQADAAECSKNSLATLRTFESDNGVVRDLQFLNAYKKGDLSQALSAFSEANHSPYTDDFTFAKFSALAQSMEKFGIKRDLHMIANVEGVLAAGLANHLNSVASICNEKQSQAEWKDACFTRGQSLAERGRDGYSKIMGINFMKSFGEKANPAFIKMREQFKTEWNSAAQNNSLWETMMAKGWSPSDLQWQEFTVRYETQGESVAKRYLEKAMQEK